MVKTEQKQLSIKDGFDPVTGKFDTAILLKMFPKARYYFILGGRGWGKTYPTIKLSIEDALAEKGAFAYVRRYKESIGDTFIQDLMAPQSEWLPTYTSGEVTQLGYWRKRWYSEKWEDVTHTNRETGESYTQFERVERYQPAIAGAFAMSTWETSKGPDFGSDKNGVKNIIVDEVLSAGGDYLTDEWNKFQNVISSLVRENYEKDTKIWLLANPVSKYNSPYFRNLGITKKMLKEPGITEIVYPKDEYGNEMSCVFCYLGDNYNIDTGIPDVKDLTYSAFFAFPNSTSKSITHGAWELAESSHLPPGVMENSDEVCQIYFIMDEETLGCKFMKYDPTGIYYLFFYPSQKTREQIIKNKNYYFTLNTDLSEYAVIGLKTGHPIAALLNKIWTTGQVYYADNTSADMMHGWMKEASKRVI